MAPEKQTTVQNTTQQSQYTPTAEETELNKLYLQQARETMPAQTGVQLQGLDLVNQLLQGGQLPGYLSQLTSGISPEAIGTQAAKLSKQYGAGFNQLGIGDSGVAFRETARGIADELLYPTEQFNIGSIQNLLNLALSGQAQVQQPIAAGTSQLSSNLAGLRSYSGTGTTTGTTTMMNPFLKSFQTSLGQTLGSPTLRNTSGTFGIGGGFGG